MVAIVVILSSDYISFLGISIGSVAAAIELINNIFAPIENLGMELQNIQQSIAGIYRIDEFLNEKEETSKNSDLTYERIVKEGNLNIKFENVNFHYEKNKDILNDINLDIKYKESITFAGRTGAGKTTLFKLILGLLESQNADSNAIARKTAQELLDEAGFWKEPPVAVDCGMLSYAILKAAEDPQKVRPAMDFARSLIENNINEQGMISYTGGKENPEMYVDTLGLTCAFLALYAKVYGVPSCEETAFVQLQMYHQYGLLEGATLPNHAFNIQTKLPLGVYGWGRGTAWYVIGLMDTYEELTTTSYRDAVLQWIVEAAESYISYQRADGGFGAILQRANTYDSSATAALAWFYERCYMLLGQEKYWAVSAGCLSKLLKKTRITGAIDECQGDTKGIGVFAQTYDTMPFAQGMAMRAIALRRNRK